MVKSLNDDDSGQVENQRLILDFCKEEKSTKEIMLYLGLSSRSYIREKLIKPLINVGKLEYVNKKHINSSNKKYKTIQK